MKRIVSLLAVLGTIGYAASASAIGTAAGTTIENTANATFTIDNVKLTEPSDTVTFQVDEILDVVVTGDDTELVGTDGTDDIDQVIQFTVANTGNGTEPFLLNVNFALAGDQFEIVPADAEVYLDSPPGTVGGIPGVFDPTDILFDLATPLVLDPVLDPLNPVQAQIVFVVADIPAGLTSGDTADVSLTATSTTKADPTDAAGTIYQNAGDGGVDAIVGTTTAVDTGIDTYLVNQLVIDLVKSAEKVAGFGDLGDLTAVNVVQVPGDTIKYRLIFTVAGDGVLDAAFITDAIPVGVDYVVGSIRASTNPADDLTQPLPLTPSDASDTDGAFKGAIPAGNPDDGKQGIVVNIEQLFDPGVTNLTATTSPAVSFRVVVDFNVKIPAL